MTGRKPLIPDTDLAHVRERYESGESPVSIAASYGATRGAVTRVLAKFGVARSQRGGSEPVPPEIVVEIVRRYKSGESAKSLGRVFYVDKATVMNVLIRNGVPVRDRQGNTRLVAPPEKSDPNRERPKPAAKYLDATAFDILTPEALYWLGFLAADGCLFEGAYPGKYRLNFKQAERYRSNVVKFKAFMQSKHKISISEHLDPGGVLRRITSITFTCDPVTSRLIALGFVPRKSSSDMTVTKELANSFDFWRGFCDGNGSIYADGYFYLAGGQVLLSQFVRFVKREFPGSLVDLQARPGCFVTRMSRSTSRPLLRALYENAEVFFERKRRAMQRYWQK